MPVHFFWKVYRRFSDREGMKTEYLLIIYATGLCILSLLDTGCLDTELLDDMEPWDTGESDPALSEPSEESSPSGTKPPQADLDDTKAPSVTALACGPKERADLGICIAEGPVSASLRFSTDEPSTVSIEASADILSAVVSVPWVTHHHAAAGDISTEESTVLTVVLTDPTGNENRLEVSVKGVSKATVAITEVLADPFGAEPGQEFVEIANIGSESVDLSGWMIDDNGDRNGDEVPSGSVLVGGGVALLVSPDFDPLAGGDPTPTVEAQIIYLDGSIGSSGLKNSAAETVELYDAAGTLISMYDGSVGTPKEGVSASRLFAELPDGDKAAFFADPNNMSTPGFVPSLRPER